MPSQYAHYRFSKQAFSALPPEAMQVVKRFRRLYEMGHQGPDILFYYHPFWDNPVSQLGSQLHEQTGAEFFTRVCGQATSEAARAYLIGLLGHYCLDCLSHPVVNRAEKNGEASHILLEKEYDRFLLAADGIASPHTYDMSDRIRLTRGECVTVAGFYPPATPGNVNSAVRFMAFGLRFLASGNREKRAKLIGRIKPSLLEHRIPEEAAPNYARILSELTVRERWALEKYPEMVTALLNHLKTGEPLGEDFEKPFG